MQPIEAGVLLFGGTNRSDEAHDTALGDTWLFSAADSQWSEFPLAPPLAPRPRWGHSMACTPPSWLEEGASATAATSCTLFGGAYLSEDDHFDDTWVFHPMASQSGKPAWQQSQPAVANPTPKPAGRWSFQLASCGSGTLMAGGSIGYRICTDDTWTFNATVFPSIWTTPPTTATCEAALVAACAAAKGHGPAQCNACLELNWKRSILAAGCSAADAEGFCSGKPNQGTNHDAIGEWTMQSAGGGANNPGYLGGGMLARTDDAKVGKGVLHFGGIAFTPNSIHIGPENNVTHFWPASSCPH